MEQPPVHFSTPPQTKHSTGHSIPSLPQVELSKNMLYVAALIGAALLGLATGSPTNEHHLKERHYYSSYTPSTYHPTTHYVPTATYAPPSRPTYTGTYTHPLSPTDGPKACCADCGYKNEFPEENRFFVSTDCGADFTEWITLQPPPCDNITCAVVEYAFITTEVPGGFFGTQYNDFFEVSITADVGHRPIGIDRYVSTTNSISGLDLGAFNSHTPAASTCCYSLNLNLDNCNRDLPITFGVAVSNAGDNLYPSALCGRVYFLDEAGNIYYGKYLSSSKSSCPTCGCSDCK